MTNDPIVARFLTDHVEYNHLTDGRRALILRELRRLHTFAGVPLTDVDGRVLQDFLSKQLADGLAPTTVRKNRHAIQPFYGWARRNGLISADQEATLRDVPDPRGSSVWVPRPYKRTEIAGFWDALDERYALVPAERLRRFHQGRAGWRRVWRHYFHMQAQAIVSLALFGGLRRNEIRTARIIDIHPDNEFIVVFGKDVDGSGPKIREVPFTVEGRGYIGEWLKLRAKLPLNHQEPWLVLSPSASPRNWVPSHPFAPISNQGFQELPSRIAPGLEYHRLRHTCATEWLRAGVQLERVSKLLGHTQANGQPNVKQTLSYLQILNDDVAGAMRRNEQEFATAVGRKNRRAA